MKIPHRWKKIDDNADAQRNDLNPVTAIQDVLRELMTYAQSNSVFHVNTQRSSAPETMYQRTQ